MKRVYLDWGVISNLKKPELAAIRDFLLAHKGSLFFVYSPAHFEDAMRSDGDERLYQDIMTLESLVDNHYITYSKKGKYNFLTIELDKEGGLDLDGIVEASNIINPIIDKLDLIDDSYILDVISKERG